MFLTVSGGNRVGANERFEVFEDTGRPPSA